MRSDMGKLIYDRHRSPHGKSEKTAKRLTQQEIANEDFDDDDNDAGRHTVRSDWRDHSYPRTRPIKKWLRSQVGRPFNDVYGEMKAVKLSGYPYGSIAELAEWMVDDKTVMFGSRIYTTKYGMMYEVDGLYVDPRNGLLCYTPERSYKWRPRVDPDVHPLTENSELRKIEGIWYEQTFDLIPDPYWMRPNRQPEMIRVLKTKRQLNRRELQLAGLKNG
jgi:hypothetical protein